MSDVKQGPKESRTYGGWWEHGSHRRESYNSQRNPHEQGTQHTKANLETVLPCAVVTVGVSLQLAHPCGKPKSHRIIG